MKDFAMPDNFRIIKITKSHTRDIEFKIQEYKKFLWFKPKWKDYKEMETWFGDTCMETFYCSSKKQARKKILEILNRDILEVV
jgi:hypothetical protein